MELLRPVGEPLLLPRRTEMTELARRRNEDVEVSLFWDRRHDRLFVLVEDVRVGDRFSVLATRKKALDVFNHPFAYARPAIH
jgi:hypothetical protein